MQNSVLVHPRARAEAGPAAHPTPAPAYGRHASLGLFAAGGVFLAGSLVDLLVLWVLQYQSQPQWEFVAVANTLESFPRFTLAIALLYAGLAFRQSSSRLWYRVLGGGMLLLGLGAALLGGLMATGYFALSGAAQAQPEALAMIRSVALKALALSGAFIALLVPLGILAVRGPKR